MKAVRQLTNAEKKEYGIRIRSEIRKEYEKYDLNVDTIIVYALHDRDEGFGFGKQRIDKFFSVMGKLRQELKTRYSADGDDLDDSFYYAMREQLKRDGIDVEQIERKIERMV